MFVGTSTGGLLAIGLAVGIEAKDLAKIYEEDGKRIFKSGDRSKYDSEGLKEVLIELLEGLEKDYKGEHKKKYIDYTLRDLEVKVGVETALLLHEKGDAVGLMLNNFTPDSETGDIS
eukprot:CAMPEP_0202971176 /NCGR_PEP_ID=MMETSP1396-20130829/24809_1 /ASSEMBLY_ACC=CAM_ASM_000872 /TAXON_ID= /ORGANISM="Pseudokeronopsis sp., Strain Brazil" /LENGTH=116 /DNA_ID=CAMNT_0049700303 /DNA_START=157 /DNA_END=504 /DNA_ORIENTATION=+